MRGDKRCLWSSGTDRLPDLTHSKRGDERVCQAKQTASTSISVCFFFFWFFFWVCGLELVGIEPKCCICGGGTQDVGQQHDPQMKQSLASQVESLLFILRFVVVSQPPFARSSQVMCLFLLPLLFHDLEQSPNLFFSDMSA